MLADGGSNPPGSTKSNRKPGAFWGIGKVTKFGHFGQTYVLFSERLARIRVNSSLSKEQNPIKSIR